MDAASATRPAARADGPRSTRDAAAILAGQGDDAQATEQLVAHLEGDDISTAFNPGYLLDGLGALNQPYVRLDFTHASKPAVLTGMDSIGGTEDSSFRYLLMPIRFGA